MKEKYKKYKEFISVPKNRSLILIGIYAVFFAFVFIVLNTYKTVSEPLPVDTTIEKQEDNTNTEVTSYEYTYDFNINDVITNIQGTFYNDDELFTMNNLKYYIKDGIIYSIDNIKQENFEYTISKFKYNTIESIVNNFSYETKTEYKDGTIKYEYIIPNNEFGKFYNEGNMNEGNVSITVMKNNYINQVDINLSSYYNVPKYLITIKYNNINNINSLDINNQQNSIN